MKRALILTILGAAAVVNVYAQGHVSVWAYNVAPYNQVLWQPDNTGVMDPAVQLQIWYGAGVVTDPAALLPGTIFTVNPGITYTGPSGTPGGYYDPQIQVLPDTGTYTFQIRASGNTSRGLVDTLLSRSILWQPTGIVSTANPANIDQNSITVPVFVPEPSSLALVGLGTLALMIFRRRS
jgi:hypothetical protein